MKHKLTNHIKHTLLPCIAFSAVAGFCSAIIITAFKLLAEWVVHLSGMAYDFVRNDPIWLPLLILAAAAIGIISSLILERSHSCMGGGIPTSVAAIRGIVSFKWLASLILLPLSALLTFLAGLPLGTEGPCVQMGTAVGDGVAKCIGGGNYRGWRRYIMTGGAAAGFSIATLSPISAIIFSMEELHKRFSPLLLTVASISVMTAQLTLQALAALGIGSIEFFHISEIPGIPLHLYFAPIVIGLIAGGCSILFTKLYHVIDKLMHAALKKASTRIIFPIIFSATALVGFFFAESLGSGHSLVESILTPGAAWYLLILIFLMRTLGMMVSNTAGTTGGIFLPTLAFGAIIGALTASGMIALGLISEEYYLLMVILGIASFLGSTSRIPLTACVFAIEALAGINNAIPIIIAITIALLVVEASGCEDFTDTVINAKTRKISKGKEAHTIEVELTVKEGAFAVGMDITNLLWPNSCVVVSFNRLDSSHGTSIISCGDKILVHYVTYTPRETAEEITSLVGTQESGVLDAMIDEA